MEGYRAGLYGPQALALGLSRLSVLIYEAVHELRAGNYGRRYKRTPLDVDALWPELTRWTPPAPPETDEERRMRVARSVLRWRERARSMREPDDGEAE